MKIIYYLVMWNSFGFDENILKLLEKIEIDVPVIISELFGKRKSFKYFQKI